MNTVGGVVSNTPLVVSFSGTLRSMARGTVTPSDLEGAIFYVGSTEEGAKDENWALKEMRGCGIDVEGQRAIYRQLREVMDRAEGQGRVGYREAGKPNSWERLNELLANNGLEAIVPVDNDFPSDGRYNYPAVIEAVNEQDLPYEVIWNR